MSEVNSLGAPQVQMETDIATITNLKKKVADLEAKVAALEAARNEALEYLQREGTPYVNSAIATLEEKT